MKPILILEAFEYEINKIDDDFNKPSTDESLFWLNQAIDKFVKLRMNGDPVHGTGFEQTEKRRSDLIKLYTTYDFTGANSQDITNPSYNKYVYVNPDRLLYILNEDVIICDNNDEHEMNTCVFECTQDSFMYRVNNSLTDFHYRYHRARPLRIRTDESFVLLTDKNYKIKKYTLGYIRKPNEIDLSSDDDYSDFEDSTMHEIVKIAAQMYLENKQDPRYQTITNEVNTQE